MQRKNRFILFILILGCLPVINAPVNLGAEDFSDTAHQVDAAYILSQMNNALRSGIPVDYGIVSACIQSIMEQGNSNSYLHLFSVLISGYPEIIENEAIGALDVIEGNLHQFLLGIIENNPSYEKFIAFKTGVNSRRLTVSERGQLAEHALEISFTHTGDASLGSFDLTAMRYASILTLTELEWKRASPLAIRHYYRTLADYLNDPGLKNRLLESINCLGAVGDSDAALVLVLQLGLINFRTERSGEYDPEITSAIIKALGKIGDNAAFDHLLYASSLPYSEEIILAAAEAIARLKW